MFDSKMLLVILLIALVIFGTKRLRSIGSDLGAAVKGFKQAMNDGESEENLSTKLVNPVPIFFGGEGKLGSDSVNGIRRYFSPHQWDTYQRHNDSRN